MMSERDADFTAASTAKRLVEAEAQLKFYRTREKKSRAHPDKFAARRP